MEKNFNKAFVIVDAQRGFMQASEGERLELPGFGELGVEGGQAIVEPINRLTAAFRRNRFPIATTQDWHPRQTAHFSSDPNFVNTWPVHCVAGTPGAELHPDLIVAQTPEAATRFIKGDIACSSPEDDTSYTGALAYNPQTNHHVDLTTWLTNNHVNDVYVAGLALGDGDEHPLCVDSTAADLQQLGFDVKLVTSAVEAVIPENREICFRNLGNRGVALVTLSEALDAIDQKVQA